MNAEKNNQRKSVGEITVLGAVLKSFPQISQMVAEKNNQRKSARLAGENNSMGSNLKSLPQINAEKVISKEFMPSFYPNPSIQVRSLFFLLIQ